MQREKDITGLFKCGYCEYEFEKRTSRLTWDEKKKPFTTPVNCPKCKNGLKPWEDMVKEIKVH